MKVLFDHQVFEEQTFGGISRYFLELARGEFGFDADVAVKCSDNIHLLSHPILGDRVEPIRNHETFLWGANFRGKFRLYDLTTRLFNRKSAATINLEHSLDTLSSTTYDIFHPTYFNPYFLDSIQDRPFVVTVYDMIHEIFPEYMSPTDSTPSWKRLLCEKAARIIAISDSTKNDLIEHLGIGPERIDVIHLASSVGRPAPSILDAQKAIGKYILFIGNRWAYKNFPLFVQAVAPILLQEEKLKLVCTGPPFNEKEKSLLAEHSISQLVEHRSVSDAELASLYGGAEMFVFPSLYEGFGMPALEALACGCPALLSDTPIMREIAADAAVFFDPRSVSDLRNAVHRVLDDRTLKKQLVELGFRRASNFSWEKTGLETAEVYRTVLS